MGMELKTALYVTIVCFLTKTVIYTNAQANNATGNSPITQPIAVSDAPSLEIPEKFESEYADERAYALIGTGPEYFLRFVCVGNAAMKWKVAKDGHVIAEMFNASNSIMTKDDRYNETVTYVTGLTPEVNDFTVVIQNVQCSDAGNYYCFVDPMYKRNTTVVVAYRSPLNITSFHSPCLESMQTTPMQMTSVMTPVLGNNTNLNVSRRAKGLQPSSKTGYSFSMSTTDIAKTSSDVPGSRGKVQPGSSMTFSSTEVSSTLTTPKERKITCNSDPCKKEKYVALKGQTITVTCSIQFTGDNSDVTFDWYKLTPIVFNSKSKINISSYASLTNVAAVTNQPPHDCIDRMHVSTLTYTIMDDAYESEEIQCEAQWTLDGHDGGSPVTDKQETSIHVCIPGGKLMPVAMTTKDFMSQASSKSRIQSLMSTGGSRNTMVSTVDQSTDTGENVDEENVKDAAVGAEAASNTGAIVGGVVGGVGMIALAVIGGALYKRKLSMASKADKYAEESGRSTSASASPSPNPSSTAA